jgi:hypothetical protein
MFSKIRGDIYKPKCTTAFNDTGGKFDTTTAGVLHTGGFIKIYLKI